MVINKEKEQDKEFCFHTEYPCNRTNCDTYKICKEQFRKNREQYRKEYRKNKKN